MCGILHAKTLFEEEALKVNRMRRRLQSAFGNSTSCSAPRASRRDLGSLPPARALRQITLVERLASQLRAMILDRNLPPGSRLGTKTELARQYGVSTGTVHAAIRLLEAQGLVQGRPGVRGGVFVSQLQPYLGLTSVLIQLRESSDQASLRDLLEARVLLDIALARHAAEIRSDEDVSALRTALAELEAAGQRVPHDVEHYMHLDWDLHDVIAQASHNATLLAIYRTIMGFIRVQVRDIIPRPDTIPATQESLAVHRGIVESIIDRDKEAATRFAELHRRRVLPDIQE